MTMSSRIHAYAYAGVVSGLGLSVWANMTHAALQPGGATPGALAMAGFWPIGLFLSLEILTRTAWTGGVALAAARVGLAVVVTVAAVVSYLHLHGLLVGYGEAWLPAIIGPLAIDGLMAVSAAALLQQAPDPAVVAVEAAVEILAPSASTSPEAYGGMMNVTVVEEATVSTARGRRKVAARLTDDDMLARVQADIGAGKLKVDPSATSLRDHLSIGAVRAQRLCDALTVTTP
jgi:hypothetical protein